MIPKKEEKYSPPAISAIIVEVRKYFPCRACKGLPFLIVFSNHKIPKQAELKKYITKGIPKKPGSESLKLGYAGNLFAISLIKKGEKVNIRKEQERMKADFSIFLLPLIETK